jgi:hypothetical protein
MSGQRLGRASPSFKQSTNQKMAARKKKPAPNHARIDISVAKYRQIWYKGERLNFQMVADHFGNRDALDAFNMAHNPSWSCPIGFYGGNVQYHHDINPAMKMLVKAGFDAQLLSKKIRFYVTICGSASADINPNHITHEYDYSIAQGFATRAEANKAAQSRFAYYNAWCRDDSGKKRTNVVTLKLHDKDGNLTEEKTN